MTEFFIFKTLIGVKHVKRASHQQGANEHEDSACRLAADL